MTKKLTLRTAPPPPPPAELPAVIELDAPPTYAEIGVFEAAAAEQCRRSQRNLLLLGKILLAGRASFDHGEFGAALRRIADDCGVSTSTLSKAMYLADGIDALPGGERQWSGALSAAEIAIAARRKLPPAVFDAAAANGDIAPTTPVKKLRELVATAAAAKKPPSRLKLERMERKLLAALEQVRAQLAKLGG